MSTLALAPKSTRTPAQLAEALRRATDRRLAAEEQLARARRVAREARTEEQALRDEAMVEISRVGELVAQRALPIPAPAEPLPQQEVFNQRDLVKRYGLKTVGSLTEWVEKGWIAPPDFTKGAWKFWYRSTVEASEKSR